MSTNPYPRGGASIVVNNPYDEVPTTEGSAGGTVRPGQFVERSSGSYVGGEGGLVVGLPIDPEKTKDDTLDEDERLRLIPALPGMVLSLAVADGEDVSEDDYLGLTGDGELETVTDAVDGIGQATEDIDATGGVEHGEVEVF